MMTAILMVPLILAVGFAIDGSRYYKARSHLQDAIDTAALAVAASTEQDDTKLRSQAESFVLANLLPNTIEGVEVASFSANAEDIVIDGSGFVETTFMRLANIERVNVAASTTTKRAPDQIVEVALVLDNTYSMIEKDPNTGETRIQTLRKAAKSLVETLLPDDPSKQGTTSIALVPYADHVNVGADKRTASWLQLNGEERSVTTGEGNRQCTKTTNIVAPYCSKYNTEPKTCTRVRDGVTESYSCPVNTTCAQYSTTKTETTCTGTDRVTTNYKFYGCVGTRVTGTLRQSDASPTARYPAYVETRQNCAQPIIPLTTDRKSLLDAVAGMTHQPSSYTALTHIPSGIVWGLNVLSPPLPFEEGEAYDPQNRSPRKVMIVMTDGDNTLVSRTNDGKHLEPSGNASQIENQINGVNEDTTAVCSSAKAKGIEIYSIAFMVKKEVAKSLLRKCATDGAHYYDATDAAKLTAAFSGIARSISQVRIAR